MSDQLLYNIEYRVVRKSTHYHILSVVAIANVLAPCVDIQIIYAPIWMNVAHCSGGTPFARKAVAASSSAYGTKPTSIMSLP
jgi:hypothetical protein